MKPYTIYPVHGRPAGRWKRVLLWTSLAVIVLLLVVAGGSYLWFRSQINPVDPDIVNALTVKPQNTVVPMQEPESPSAMNVLVLGSDRRQDDDDKEEFGRSDTIIMVHVDPDKDYLSIMSLPRDLRVQVPGYGMEKINAAFAHGGPVLTIRTVEQLTGVDINHYVQIDFEAFKDITNTLGGVYVDVDRRYYNDNPNWELIKLAPGYQLLNGADALDYVRFRHDRNGDFGRIERQQRFLNAVREQAMGWDLLFKLPRLINALFSNINTDLGANDLLKLAYWGIRLDGGCIRQVSLAAEPKTINDIAYVVTRQRDLRDAIAAFQSPQGTASTSSASTGTTRASTVSTSGRSTGSAARPVGAPDLKGVEVDVLNANGRPGAAAVAGKWLASLGAKVVNVGNAASGGQKKTAVVYPKADARDGRLVAEALGVKAGKPSNTVARVTVTLGLDFAIPTTFAPTEHTVETIPNSTEWKALATMIPFALQAPAYLPEGCTYYDRMPPTGGTYDIDVKGGTKPALRMIYRVGTDAGASDQYLGITETTWLDAPAASRGQKVKADGVTFTIVGTDKKVDHIWWKADGVLYWVSNTLSYVYDKAEMLRIAQSMISVPKP
ncbi:MAG: LCP family protein [Thermoleophilia bacterium]|jgi:LCP family protein required for cell wall assembly